jgi:ATP-dependent Clp protease ATP-binding subunit ClpC
MARQPVTPRGARRLPPTGPPNDEVPETLTGKRLVALDLGGMVAGTKYRGEFEERLKSVIEEIMENADELIVFLDELHTVVGAGAAEGAIDAATC